MRGIADTGFLVAFANRGDAHHHWAVDIAGQVGRHASDAPHRAQQLVGVLRRQVAGFDHLQDALELGILLP